MSQHRSIYSSNPWCQAASHRVRPVLVFLLSALLSIQALAGQEGGQTTSRFGEIVKVEVVNVDVVVTDRSGQPIKGLGREDFILRVDGKPVPIANFYADSQTYSASGSAGSPQRPSSEDGFTSVAEADATDERRAHVVLLVDHTRLSATNRKRAFQALRDAVDRLDSNALISVVGIEGGLVFYSDFLFDHSGVHRILDDISRVSLKTDINETERRAIFSELARGMSGGILARSSLADEGLMVSRLRTYAAQEYARGLQSLKQIETVASTLSGLDGRKLLLYLGEGIPTRPGEGLYVEHRNRFSGPELGMRHQDFNSDYTRTIGQYDLTQQMQQLAQATNRAGVTLYAVNAEGNHGNAVRSALTEQGATSETVSVVTENFREPLEYASKATGGRLLESSGRLADQLVDMVVGLQTYYSLGFTPPEDWAEGSSHSIDVQVSMKGLRVSHREEIVLPKENEREAGAMIAALMYQTLDNRLGIKAQPGQESARREDGNAVLPVLLQIPIGKLELLPREDRHVGSLSIFVTSKDREGNPGPVQKIPFHLAIPEEKVVEARADEAFYDLPVVLRPGDQQVAIGVRDDISGSFSALRLDVTGLSPKP